MAGIVIGRMPSPRLNGLMVAPAEEVDGFAGVAAGSGLVAGAVRAGEGCTCSETPLDVEAGPLSRELARNVLVKSRLEGLPVEVETEAVELVLVTAGSVARFVFGEAAGVSEAGPFGDSHLREPVGLGIPAERRFGLLRTDAELTSQYRLCL
ncbi:MAG: hypothetical protein ACLQGP_08195 [Isosphaeraceae bacterium]